MGKVLFGLSHFVLVHYGHPQDCHVPEPILSLNEDPCAGFAIRTLTMPRYIHLPGLGTMVRRHQRSHRLITCTTFRATIRTATTGIVTMKRKTVPRIASIRRMCGTSSNQSQYNNRWYHPKNFKCFKHFFHIQFSPVSRPNLSQKYEQINYLEKLGQLSHSGKF